MQTELILPFSDSAKDAAEKEIVDQSKKIEYFMTEFSLEILALKMSKGEYVVPSYQREFTWEPERKWRFIESLIMGLPVPFLFFWEEPETGNLEIVDGSQRLRTIEEFFLGDLALGELEKLPKLSGFRFSDLPESRQRKLNNRSIRGIILNEHADKQARLDLFDRINTGSKVANYAEIRRGALAGPFLDLVIELAKEPLFVSLTPVPVKQEKEREREELVTRFFAYGDGLDSYADEVSAFLYSYSKRMNTLFLENPSLANIYKDRFKVTMEFVSKYFPYGFKRMANGAASPRTRFEAISIGSYLALKDRPGLVSDRAQIRGWVEGEAFKAVTRSDGANAVKKLSDRLEFVRNQLLAG